jgi:hypothetical protein
MTYNPLYGNCPCSLCQLRRGERRIERRTTAQREAWEYALLLILIGLLAAVLLWGIP